MKNFVLPDSFKVADIGILQTFLADSAEASVRIDAGNLRRLDTRLVEFLMCAEAAWRAKGLGFEIARLTPAQDTALTQLGISPDILTRSVAA